MKLYVVTHEFWGDQTELVSIEDSLPAARDKLVKVWNEHADAVGDAMLVGNVLTFFDLPAGGCITPIDPGQHLGGATVRDIGDIIEGKGCIRT